MGFQPENQTPAKPAPWWKMSKEYYHITEIATRALVVATLLGLAILVWMLVGMTAAKMAG